MSIAVDSRIHPHSAQVGRDHLAGPFSMSRHKAMITKKRVSCKIMRAKIVGHKRHCFNRVDCLGVFTTPGHD